MIKFNVVVKNRIAQFKNTIVPVSHNEGYIVNFTMDEEWTGLITAVLVYEDGTVITPRILNENNEIELPALKTGMLYAGLVSGDVKTTTPARINIAKSIKDIPEGEIIPDPEAPIYNQIIEKINQVANSVTRLDGKLVLAVDELKLRDFNLDQKVESYRNEYNQYYISLSEDIDEILNDLYNLKRDTYNKEYIDGVINGINENIEDIDADIENLKRKTNQLDNDKADKENTYTKDEVNQKIDAIPEYDDTNIRNNIKNIEDDVKDIDDDLTSLKGDFNQYKETTDGAISDINDTIGDEPASEITGEYLLKVCKESVELWARLAPMLGGLPSEERGEIIVQRLKDINATLGYIIANKENL